MCSKTVQKDHICHDLEKCFHLFLQRIFEVILNNRTKYINLNCNISLRKQQHLNILTDEPKKTDPFTWVGIYLYGSFC